MGSAIDSAFFRSFSIVVPTCRNTSASPVTATLSAASEPARVNSGESASMRFRTTSSDPVMRASTSALSPFVEARGGACNDQ